MIEAKHLFDGYDEEGYHNNRCHMHEIVCLLGEPPSASLQRSSHTWRLFDENGKPPVESYSFHRSNQTNVSRRKMENTAVDQCHAPGHQDETIQWRKSR